MGPLAMARMAVGRFDEALAWARRAVEAETGASFTYEPLTISCLAHLGRDAEAREQGARLLARLPGAHHGLGRLLLPPDTFALYEEGLRRAGVHLPG
jgi:hypothetical protein